MFPEDMPLGLPQLRGIEQHIDLVSGVVLPNRTICKSNPKETKEIQKQVLELMNKGGVEKNLSPYVIPIILFFWKGWKLENMFRL